MKTAPHVRLSHVLPLVACLALPMMTLPSARALAQEPPPPALSGTLLDISAEAQVSAAPDIATISAGVTTQADTAAGAMKDNAQAMANVFAALKKLNIEDKDIQTSSIHLNPQYSYDNTPRGEQRPPRITGYQAMNTVTVALHGALLGDIGPVLDALATAGANNLNGPNFSIENKDDLLDKARMQAVEKAQKRALLYATAAGLHVKRIVSISEQSSNHYVPPRPMMMKAMMAHDASAPTQVAPGEVDMSVTLGVKYELTP